MKEIRFNLFGTNWTMQEVPVINPSDKDYIYRGVTRPDSYTIELADKSSRGIQYTKDDKNLTKLHELVHAIFITGGYESCNNDEPLVEWVAKCIKSLREQKII